MEEGAGVGRRRELGCRSCGRRRRAAVLRSSARRSAARRWPSPGGDVCVGGEFGIGIWCGWGISVGVCVDRTMSGRDLSEMSLLSSLGGGVSVICMSSLQIL